MPKTEDKSTVDEKPDVSRDGEETKTDDPAKDLKVVVSLKGGITTVGIQRTGTDPYIESFERCDLADVLDEDRPRGRQGCGPSWADAPKNPAYSRPSTSGGGRQTTAANDSDARLPRRGFGLPTGADPPAVATADTVLRGYSKSACSISMREETPTEVSRDG